MVYSKQYGNGHDAKPKSAQRQKILIVEDEAALLRTLADSFSDDGFAVSEARTGEEGVRIAFSTQPDVILLDLLLPGMSGIDVLKRLRADAWGKRAEVILLTNIDRDAKVLADAVELGAYEYLVKSHWQIRDVIKKVRGKLGMAS